MTILRAALVFLLTGIAVEFAAAQGSPSGVEVIAATLTTTPPENVHERLTLSLLDLQHEKKLGYEATLRNDSLTDTALVDLWFIWADPQSQGQTLSSPPISTLLQPGQLSSPGGQTVAMFTIPYSPSEVGLRVQNNGPGGPVVVRGRFTHELLIPEPRAMVLGLLACLGATAVRRVNRNDESRQAESG